MSAVGQRPKLVKRLVRGPQVQHQPQQYGHGAEEEAQRLARAHDRQGRGRGTVGLGFRRTLPAEQPGLKQIRGQAGQGQGDDGGFGGHLVGHQFDHQHLGPQEGEYAQVDVQSEPSHDHVGIEIGVASRQHQGQGQVLPPGLGDDGRRARVPTLIDGLEDRPIEPVAGQLGPQHQEQAGRQEHLSRLKEGQPETATAKGARDVGKRPFHVDRQKPQHHQQRGRRGDLPESARVGQHQQAGHGNAAVEDVDEQRIAEHQGRGHVEHAADQGGHPKMPFQRNQPGWHDRTTGSAASPGRRAR